MCLPISGFAQANWPNQPVRFVIPFPGGSTPDAMMRLLGDYLSKRWGQPVVVDNRPGASGVIGMKTILAAPANGYTFGFVQGSAISIVPSTIKDVGYDYERDFAPVILASVSPLLLAVPFNSPYHTLDDLLKSAKTKAESVEVADPGQATTPHLAAALLGIKSGARFLHVHFQGGPQALQSLIGGQTQAQIEGYNVFAPMVQSGRIRILASLGDRVEPGLESIPLASATVPEAVAYGWFGVVARKGTEASVISRLNRDFAIALREPEIVAKAREFGVYPRPSSPEDLDSHIARDRKHWDSVLKTLNIQVK